MLEPFRLANHGDGMAPMLRSILDGVDERTEHVGWLENEVVLLTGGGSGIGRAVVDRFLAEGARVAVLELSESKADDLAAAHGDRVHVVIGDATKLVDNRRAVAEALTVFKTLDCFVGNAGVWDWGTSLEDLPAEAIDAAFDELFGLNVKACLLGAKASLDALRATNGSMIFTASNAALWPGGGGPLYTASKHALVGLVRQLAYELCPDVRVNGVAVGGAGTDLRGPRALGLDTHRWGDMPVEDIMEQFSPLSVRAVPADYAGHYVLLASRRDSRTVTGTIVDCDGGVGIRGRREAEARRATVVGDDTGKP
jgi:NAD(P)-dependent dehydrogenase (short-subunit alcohol dehydrogenase family)